MFFFPKTVCDRMSTILKKINTLFKNNFKKFRRNYIKFLFTNLQKKLMLKICVKNFRKCVLNIYKNNVNTAIYKN